ncbi:MAG: DUF2752 domain-containing protein [Planctomycetota bacterium]|nr:DUF2752 domain-containing protein [Planctomycetota bacterium]
MRKDWIGPMLTVAATAAFVILAHFAVVDAGHLRIAGLSLPEVCPARAWGWRCPGCGLTRASVQLARGSWRAAWDTHPGAYALLGVVLLEASAMLWTPRTRRTARWALAALLILLSLAYWISWKNRS